MSHEHHHEAPAYPHLRIRHKAFPWTASDCALFDLDCKKAAAKGEQAHH